LLGHQPTSRKLRLLMCAWCRTNAHLFPDERSVAAIEAAERYVDGAITEVELDRAREGAREAIRRWKAEDIPKTARHAGVAASALDVMDDGYWRYWSEGLRRYGEHVQPDPLYCRLHRDIFGNPFRLVAFSPDWRTSTAVAIARGMYESRDFSAMPILADALQDAGCDNEDILSHCRQPGEHVRGCWVVDLVLGKS